MRITDSTKMMAATIVAAIVAASKENPERSVEYLEGADYRIDPKGDWIKGPNSVWWSGYDPENPKPSHETWQRVRVLVPWGQRVARKALWLAMDIERQAKAMENGPEAED